MWGKGWVRSEPSPMTLYRGHPWARCHGLRIKVFYLVKTMPQLVPTLFTLNLPDRQINIYMHAQPSDLLLQVYPSFYDELELLLPRYYVSRSGLSFDAIFTYDPLSRSLKPLKTATVAVEMFKIYGKTLASGPGTGKLSRSLDVSKQVALAICNLLLYHSEKADGRPTTPDYVRITDGAIIFYERAYTARFFLTVVDVITQGNLRIYKIKEKISGFEPIDCYFASSLEFYDHTFETTCANVYAIRGVDAPAIAYLVSFPSDVTVSHPEHKEVKLAPGTYLLFHPVPRRGVE